MHLPARSRRWSATAPRGPTSSATSPNPTASRTRSPWWFTPEIHPQGLRPGASSGTSPPGSLTATS
eukprot:8856879-Alexandrium_andersonii.AAC.1